MCTAEKHVTTILTVIAEVERKYRESTETISQKDKESSDLQHEIELSNFNAYEGYRLAKELQTVLKERREAKDERETLELLHNFFCKNPQFKNGLAKCHQDIKLKEKIQSERRYTPRVRTDLTIA